MCYVYVIINTKDKPIVTFVCNKCTLVKRNKGVNLFEHTDSNRSIGDIGGGSKIIDIIP